MNRLFIAFALCLLAALVVPAASMGQDQWVGSHQTAAFEIKSISVVDANTAFAAGVQGLILKTADGGKTWSAYPSGQTVDLYSISFVDANHGWAVGNATFPGGPVIVATTDGGVTWTRQGAPAGFSQVLYSVKFKDTQHGWVVGAAGKVARTTNGGTSWQAVTMPAAATFALYGVDFYDLNNGYIAGGSFSAGYVMQSTDGGITWSDPSIAGQISALPLYSVKNIDAQTAVIVGNNGSIYQTTDGGADWNVRTAPPGALRPLNSVASVGNTVMAGGDTVVIVSTDGGSTWHRKTTGLSNAVFPQQLIDGIGMATANAAWAVGQAGTLIKTYDGGNSWTWEPSPYSSSEIKSVTYTSGLAYFCGVTGILGRNANPVIASVREEALGIPREARLLQNYPNPFNPTTTIEYHLAARAVVELKVFNIIGQEVATLVNEAQSAGVYHATFDASKVASGVYMYRLKVTQAGAPSYIASKKMVLLK